VRGRAVVPKAVVRETRQAANATAPSPAIVMSDISVRFAAAAGASVLAVDRVSFSLNAGEFLSLVALLVAARRRFLTY